MVDCYAIPVSVYSIWQTTDTHDDMTCLEFQDTGTGVPPATLAE